jgi:hypothetical protein
MDSLQCHARLYLHSIFAHMSSSHFSTSSSRTSQTTHVTYSVTPTSSQPSPNTGVVLALGISLVLVAVLLVIVSVTFMLHLRRNGFARRKPTTKTGQNATLRVTPFSISGGVSGPRYGEVYSISFPFFCLGSFQRIPPAPTCVLLREIRTGRGRSQARLHHFLHLASRIFHRLLPRRRSTYNSRQRKSMIKKWRLS